jgi:hypothetical protein|tara:strand:- start:190 stop:978 length:789 start_codon:yes stop_codon:yes gene_type:complete
MPRGGSYEVERNDQAVEETISIEDQFWNALRSDEDFDAKKWQELGIDLNMRNGDGYPAIVIAQKNDKTGNVKKLILAGADAKLTGDDQYTLLMRAASRGDMDFITWLLDNTDIDINAQDKDGDTAVNEAVYHQKPKTAALLLDRDADPYILNYKKESLWDWARKTENQELMGLVYKRMYPVYENFTQTGHNSVTTSEKTPEGAVLSQTFNFTSRMVSTVVSGPNGPLSAEQSRFSAMPQRTIAAAGNAMRILHSRRRSQHGK